MIVRTPEDKLDAARRRHAIFLAVSALVVVLVIALAHAVLLPFVLALVIAYVLTPAVAWVERKRTPRPLAIVIVYVVVLGLLWTFVRTTAPRVGHELAALRRELPVLSQTIRHEWVPYVQGRLRAMGLGGAAPTDDTEETAEAPAVVVRPRSDGSYAIELPGPLAVSPTKGGGYTVEQRSELRDEPFDLDRLVGDLAGKSLSYAQQNALEIVKFGRDVIAAVSRVFFVFGITLMLAAYMMLTRERILRFFTSLVRPPSRASFAELLTRIDSGLAGVVRGQLVICLLNGLLSAVGFAIVGLKYWPVLALVATVLSLIPIFGSIISTVPAVALGLTQSIGTALFVLVWIICIHQLEANVLNPKIMGDAAKIHPVLVIFSLLVGEHAFGVVGALLAVPTMSIVQSVFIHVRKAVQGQDPEMAHEPVGSIPAPPPVEPGT
jgi:predicted PurR-regulated permease PerM